MSLHVTDVLIGFGAAAALLFAALHDIAFRIVPNWVSAVLAVAGALRRLAEHQLPAGLACGGVVFVLAAICWRRGWLGGGDVKLLGATAILIPPASVPGFIAAVAFAGGGLAILYLSLERLLAVRQQPQRRRRGAPLLRRVLAVEYRRIRRRMSLPYATAITIAALLTMAGT